MEKKNKVRLMEDFANVILEIIRENELSEKFISANIEDEWFEDACKYTDMRHEISEICYTMKTMAKYM